MGLSKEELEKLDQEESVKQLTGRVQLGSVLIKSLIGEEDPRAQAAMEELRTQQQQINVLIERKTRGSRPEPTVVSMHPARFASRFEQLN